MDIDLAGAKPVDPSPAPVDIEASQEEARATIAYWLLGLLTLLESFAFACMFFLVEHPTFAQLKEMVELLAGPIVALVSAATGFYFGANSRKPD